MLSKFVRTVIFPVLQRLYIFLVDLCFWGIPAFVIVFIFASCFFQLSTVLSGSMSPNLVDGDRILVSKYSYGWNTNSLIFGLGNWLPFLDEDYAVYWDVPRRGHVVVFSKQGVDYVKRVVGIPGDTISFVDGIAHVNSEQLPRVKAEKRDLNLSTNIAGDFFWETNDGYRYLVIDRKHYGNFDNVDAVVVPDGYYFVVGDNRDNSLDSRSLSVGMIPQHAIVGRVNRVVFAFYKVIHLWKFWLWNRFDSSRLWKKV